MQDKNGVICEYDGYLIDPKKTPKPTKTLEEIHSEREELFRKLMEKYGKK